MSASPDGDAPRARPDRELLAPALSLAAAITAIDETGVLDRLVDGGGTVDELASSTGVDHRLLAAVLDGLIAAGVVDRSDGRCSVDPTTHAYLRRSRQLWGGLGEALRTGHRRFAVDTAERADDTYPEVAPYLARRFDIAAPALAAAMSPPAAASVLDVGSGAAAWSIPFAEADPDSRVTVVDLPSVLPVASAAAAAAGVTDQFELVAADLHRLELTTTFDVIIVANVLHLFDPAVAGALVSRLARRLAPGGALAVVDAIVPAGRAPDADLALYALSLTLRTERGGLFSFASCASWLRASGLSDIHQVALPTPPMSAIIGTSPPSDA